MNEKLSTKGNGVKKTNKRGRKTRRLMTYRNTLRRHTKATKNLNFHAHIYNREGYPADCPGDKVGYGTANQKN